MALEEDKDNALTKKDRLSLQEAIQDVKNAEELIKQAKKTLSQLNNISKGEQWEENLSTLLGNIL